MVQNFVKFFLQLLVVSRCLIGLVVFFEVPSHMDTKLSQWEDSFVLSPGSVLSAFTH